MMEITEPMERLRNIFSDNPDDDEGYLGLVLETTGSNLCFPLCKMGDPYSKSQYISFTAIHKNAFLDAILTVD